MIEADQTSSIGQETTPLATPCMVEDSGSPSAHVSLIGMKRFVLHPNSNVGDGMISDGPPNELESEGDALIKRSLDETNTTLRASIS